MGYIGPRPDLAEYNRKNKKGRSLEEQHGKEKAIEITRKNSLNHLGEKNSFYNKKHSEKLKKENSRKIKIYYETHHPPSYIDGSSKNRFNELGKWKKIAKKCYERDSFACQECKKRGGLIHAHHIIPWSISKNDSLKNLITLCPSCHAKIHAKMRKNR